MLPSQTLLPSSELLPGFPHTWVVAADHQKISHMPGFDSFAFTLRAERDFSRYDVKLVPSPDSDIAAGTTVESAVIDGVAEQDYTVTLDSAELTNAMMLEGPNNVKVFFTVPLAEDSLNADDMLVAEGLVE